MRIPLSMLLLSTGLLGCGPSSAPPCVTSSSLSVFTANASSPTAGGVADHNAKTPGNQQKFSVYYQTVVVSGSCAVPAAVPLVYADWSTSDAIDIQISSAQDQTNGLATCIGATLSPATITASVTQGGVTKTASSTLTCQ